MAKNKDKKKIPFNVFRKGITAGALGLAMLLGGAGMLTACGEKGDRGDTGSSGKSAYELAVEQGFQGTLTEWLDSLKGQSGGAGSAGNDGVGIASITKTGTDGLVDTYTITFTNGSTTTFTITNGENGTTPSAPEVTINAQGYWVINGTPTSTLATAEDGKTPYIEGGYWYIDGVPTGVKAQGDDGDEGKSAFDIYKEQNPSFTGDEADWLETLKGQDGTDGATWLSGDVAPTTEGKDGDFYLDESTFDIYKNTDGTWNKIGTLSADTNNITTTELSPWYNKSAVFVGDSITYGTGCDGDKYWEILEETLQLSSVTGMGVAGSCISTTSDYGTNNSPLINRYDTIPEADLISIFMGSNDYGHDTPLGTIADTTDVSFYGALNVIIPALQAKYPSSRIVFVTPMHRYGFGTNSATSQTHTYDYIENGEGNTLKEYVDALKEVCERYSVPVVDMFTMSGLNPSLEVIRTNYMPDGIHPNAEGHQLMANIMKYWYELYANTEQIENIVTTPTTPVVTGDLSIGNAYSEQFLTAQNRMSVKENVYLKAGTVIDLNDSAYKFGLYNQTSEEIEYASIIDGEWKTTPYTITTTGWYGVAIAKADSSNFDTTTDSTNLSDYVSITEVSIRIGNAYAANNLEDATRASSNSNIYLKAGTTISLVDTTNYAWGVYSQGSKTQVIVTQDSDYQLLTDGWVSTSYTITEDGWYGIALKKADNSAFDFSTESTDFSTYYTLTTNS